MEAQDCLARGVTLQPHRLERDVKEFFSHVHSICRALTKVSRTSTCRWTLTNPTTSANNLKQRRRKRRRKKTTKSPFSRRLGTKLRRNQEGVQGDEGASVDRGPDAARRGEHGVPLDRAECEVRIDAGVSSPDEILKRDNGGGCCRTYYPRTAKQESA